MYSQYDAAATPCLIEYRKMILNASKKSKNYVGTVDVYGKGTNKSRRFSINYSKGRSAYCLFHREEDRVFAEEVDDDFGRTKVMYDNYSYDITRHYDIGTPPKKSRNRGWTTESALITPNNLFIVPKILFLRAACFDERIDDDLLGCMLEEAGIEMYNKPMASTIINAETDEVLEGKDKLSAMQQMVSVAFNQYTLPLSDIYSSNYRVVKRMSKKDRIDEILLKADFEGMIEDGGYGLEVKDRLIAWSDRPYVEDVDLRRKGDGKYLVQVGYRGEHTLDAVGGVESLVFLMLLAENKPSEITDRFTSYKEFKSCVNAKAKHEKSVAKLFSTKNRFRQGFTDYVEDESFWRTSLLDSVKRLYE
ncbi:MAG: hypothetical protein ABIA12_01485 [Candidatus Aenigmatarchaeota archaeon]